MLTERIPIFFKHSSWIVVLSSAMLAGGATRPQTVTISVSPSTATLNPSQIATFTAKITGTMNTGITWSVPSLGTLSSGSAGTVYTAPSIISPNQTVTITAKSMADPTKTASVLISLASLITVAINPSSGATLYQGGTQQFTAVVSGTSNPNVRWSLSPAVGSVSSSGIYTAPSNVTADQTITVMAQALAAPTASASSAIKLRAGPAGVQFSLNPYHLTGLSYNGQSYYLNVSAVVQGAVFQAPNGATTDAGWNSPSRATQPDSLSFQQVYNAGGPNQFTLKIVFATYDSRTIKAVASVTNNDPVNKLININLHHLGVTLPGPANQYNQNIPMEVNQYNGNPVSFLSGNWGSVAMWQSGYPTSADQLSYYSSSSQTAFINQLSSAMNYGPNYYSMTIMPGQTQSFTQFVRFGSSTDTPASLAPEAYNEYRTVFPYLVNWPDRRPIGQWLISDAGNGRSATNPRGYLWDKTINIANTANFQSRVLSTADSVIGIMNAVYPKPQGLLIWDLEGQEFNQAFTYVGHPDYLPSLAPEMDAVADQLMNKIKAAGYRVGVTVRPNHFLMGTSLPPTCIANSNYSLADKFINLSAIYPYRGYLCSATNVWSGAGANMPSAQTTTQNSSQVLSLLESKVSYANNRWGATMFYIDSDVWEGGTVLDPSIIRTLQTQFPDCLFIPEFANNLHFGAAAPYEQASMGNTGTQQATRNLYPGAFGVVNMANANFTAQFSTFVNSVTNGDALMFEAWWNAPEIPFVQQIYAAAAAAQPQKQ